MNDALAIAPELAAALAAERKSARAVTPRLAASLVLWREGPNGPELLMGRRSNQHRFMPNLFVFPGGVVDRADARAPQDAPSPDASRLERVLKPARARAAPLAAIRETFEETGLLVGRSAAVDQPCPLDPWRRFEARGLVPATSRLKLLARATTPAALPIRFDAWFFLADWADVDVDDAPCCSGELGDVDWYPLAETASLDTHLSTKFVLRAARARLAGDSDGNAAPPWLRTIGRRQVVRPLR